MYLKFSNGEVGFALMEVDDGRVDLPVARGVEGLHLLGLGEAVGELGVRDDAFRALLASSIRKAPLRSLPRLLCAF